MIDIKEWLSSRTTSLNDAGIESARLDAMIILESHLKKPREWILSHSEVTLDVDLIEELEKKINKRMNRTPIAYIVGEKEFYGRTFFVNEGVLIPRPESEAIIEMLIDIDRSIFDTILDVGTGSGCLAISAKLEIPEATVSASDNSKNALLVAYKNAKKFRADIGFKKSDLLESIDLPDKSIVLANLPYVPDSLVTSEEVKKEPVKAIFSGPDGMDLFKRMWDQLSTVYLNQISIITESLLSQHSQMTELANKSGYHLERTNGLAQLFKKT